VFNVAVCCISGEPGFDGLPGEPGDNALPGTETASSCSYQLH